MEGDSHDLNVCGRSCRVYVVGADSKSDDADESTLSEQIKTSPPTSTLNSARRRRAHLLTSVPRYDASTPPGCSPRSATAAPNSRSTERSDMLTLSPCSRFVPVTRLIPGMVPVMYELLCSGGLDSRAVA